MSAARTSSQCHNGARRITFYSVPVDLLSLEETVAIADDAMATGKMTRHTALNVAKLVNLRRDKELAADVCESDIVGIDGAGIVLGLRLFGVRSVKRVAGIDLMYALLDHCARTGRKPFILGARQSQLERAMEIARSMYPGLQFAGARNGYFPPDEEDAIVAEINDSGADCLFVAMPTPRKERFLNRHGSFLGAPFIMGVGGSVDVLAGHVSRAPEWMQAWGLEWFHRLYKEPRKMFLRYARTNTAYLLLLVKSVLRGRNPVEKAQIAS